MMDELFTQVIGGLIVVIVAAWLGVSSSTRVLTQYNNQTRKTGKWIMIISTVMIVIGLAWAGSGSPAQGGFDFSRPGTTYGLALVAYGLLFYFIGKVVAWFQRP